MLTFQCVQYKRIDIYECVETSPKGTATPQTQKKVTNLLEKSNRFLLEFDAGFGADSDPIFTRFFTLTNGLFGVSQLFHSL